MGFLSFSSYINKRMEICKKCPLFLKRLASPAICNPKLYINPDTNELSTEFKEGYINGCGCIINNLIKDINGVCRLNRW